MRNANVGLDGEVRYSDPSKELMYQIIQRAVLDAMGRDTWIKRGTKYIPKHNLSNSEIVRESYAQSPEYYDRLNSIYYEMREQGKRTVEERSVVKEEARQWIMEKDGWFEELCGILGISPEDIREKIL